MVEFPTAADFAARLPEADALLIRATPLPAEAVAKAGLLRVIARHGVGCDNIPFEAVNGKGIPVAIVGDVNSAAVAEHALFMMLALARRCRAYDAAVRAGDWEIRNGFGASELWSKKVLLIGFGRIGQEVARRLSAFDAEVLVYDPYASRKFAAAQKVRLCDDLLAAAREADLVSLHVPLTPETENLVGAGFLAAMKPSAYLVNTARGGLVDEAALDEALERRSIAGAGLDTFAEEPPSKPNPLFARDEVLLSPHSAALTGECAARMAIEAARNVLRGLDGELDPARVVNRDAVIGLSPKPTRYDTSR